MSRAFVPEELWTVEDIRVQVHRGPNEEDFTLERSRKRHEKKEEKEQSQESVMKMTVSDRDLKSVEDGHVEVKQNK